MAVLWSVVATGVLLVETRCRTVDGRCMNGSQSPSVVPPLEWWDEMQCGGTCVSRQANLVRCGVVVAVVGVVVVVVLAAAAVVVDTALVPPGERRRLPSSSGTPRWWWS